MTTSPNKPGPVGRHCPGGAPSRGEVVLEIREVSKVFGQHRVLEGIDLCLGRGELVSLLGVSGSGKTTLFNIIAGLLQPDRGSVWLGGEEITGRSGQVAYMLQKDLLLRHLTIVDNASLPLRLRGMGREEACAEASRHFARFGLAGTESLYPAELSGGMAQRVALLRTWLFSSEAVLLDEPFSALDALTKRQLHRWFLEMRESLQLSTLFITHDIDEAILLSDRVLVLSGQPAQIAAQFVIAREDHSDGFALTEAFVHYKREILAAIGSGEG